MATRPLALLLLVSPGELDADMAVGSTQRFGVPMGYGGPHAAFLATKDEFKRSLQGGWWACRSMLKEHRLTGWRCKTREQHIRREKATSNICTAQVLLAVMAGMYAVYHGPEGLKAIARRVHGMTGKLAAGLRAGMGFAVEPEAYFDTITVLTGERTEAIHQAAVAAGMNLRRVAADRIGISLDETTTAAIVEAVSGALGPRRRSARCRSVWRFRRACSGRASFLASGVQPVPLGDGDAAVYAASGGPGPGAGPGDDSAGLVHDEAECDDGDAAGDVAGVWESASVCASGQGARVMRRCWGSWRNGCARLRDTMRSRSSQTLARRVSMPGCWRLVLTTRAAVKATGRSA